VAKTLAVVTLLPASLRPVNFELYDNVSMTGQSEDDLAFCESQGREERLYLQDAKVRGVLLSFN
jgi:hypothetical protein